MKYAKWSIERLATLNAWVTACIVLFNLLVSFVAFSIPTFRSISLMIFVSGTVGGAASNYRRLQEAYVQQLRQPGNELEPPTNYDLEAISDETTTQVVDALAKPEILHTKAAKPANTPIEDKSTYFILKLQIFLSPIFGGLFAVVLYAVFVSGIIQGELFPKFKGTSDDFSTPYEFADNTLPATNADLSKAILWAFIAGFAEGFVPNFIDKLVKDSEQNK
jgi:hypothetical protein